MKLITKVKTDQHVEISKNKQTKNPKSLNIVINKEIDHLRNQAFNTQ